MLAPFGESPQERRRAVAYVCREEHRKIALVQSSERAVKRRRTYGSGFGTVVCLSFRRKIGRFFEALVASQVNRGSRRIRIDDGSSGGGGSTDPGCTGRMSGCCEHRRSRAVERLFVSSGYSNTLRFDTDGSLRSLRAAWPVTSP